MFLISQCLPVSTSFQITLQQFLFVRQEQKDMFHLLYRHLYAVVRVAWRGVKHLTFSLSPSQQHQVSLSSSIIFSDFSPTENIACFLFLVLRKIQQNLFMNSASRMSIEACRDPPPVCSSTDSAEIRGADHRAWPRFKTPPRTSPRRQERRKTQ